MATIKEKIRAEVELLLNENTIPDFIPRLQGKRQAYRDVLDIIDSLPEEKPAEDLEEAAKKHADNCLDIKFPTLNEDLIRSDVIYSFKLGAKWQKEQMMKDAVEGQIYGSDGSHWIESEINENLKGKEGDKVRIVVLKKEDEQ